MPVEVSDEGQITFYIKNLIVDDRRLMLFSEMSYKNSLDTRLEFNSNTDIEVIMFAEKQVDKQLIESVLKEHKFNVKN